MTLNQVIRRIQKIAEAHKQIRSFFQGDVQEFLTDKGRAYATVLAQITSGNLSTGSKAVSVSIRLWFLDLVNVSAGAKLNELDVQSDMLEVGKDILGQINNPVFNDWRLSSDNTLQIVSEQLDDMLAGCYVDITITTMYPQNICQVPTELTDYSPTDNDMKLVYDEIYIATGTEGTTLTVPAIQGKKVLFVVRDNAPLYKVSNNPGSTEYTWDFTNIGLSVQTAPGQRFLILYRTL